MIISIRHYIFQVEIAGQLCNPDYSEQDKRDNQRI